MSLVIFAWLWYALWKNKADGMLEKEEFQAKYGTLTEGLRLTSTLGIYWNLIVLIRWQLTSAILILLSNHPEVQILLLYGISVLNQCLILYSKPMPSKIDNIIAFLNEVLISFYLKILMLLTDFMGENKFNEQFGTCLIIIVMLSIALNFGKLIYSVI
jgi:hypothetical protein